MEYDGSSWKTLSPLPYSFYGGGVVVYNNCLHLLGGYGDYTAFYKWDGSSWTKLTNLPAYLEEGTATVYNGEIHYISTTSDATYYPHYAWNGSSWREVCSSSTSNLFYSKGSNIISFNNNLYLLGGYWGDTWYKFTG